MITASYPIRGGDFDTAGAASRSLKGHLQRIGVEGETIRRIMITAYEAEMNVVIHAKQGNLWVRFDEGRVDMEVIDEGPGIPDLELAMTPGFSTAPRQAVQLGFGAGMGLPNIRKASDLFEIESRVGRGTHVRSTVFLKAQESWIHGTNSLAVEAARCNGCLDCLKACPTAAMRVYADGPRILDVLCVDCTDCLAACKKGVFSIRERDGAATAPPGVLRDTLILPAAFLTQFGPKVPPALVMASLRSQGLESIRFLEEWEDALRRTVRGYAAEAQATPVISPLCPVIVNLIESRFPSLIEQLAPFLTPAESAARSHGREEAAVVVACPGQRTRLAGAGASGRLQVLTPAALTPRILPLIGGQASPVDRPEPPAVDLPDAEEPGVLQASGLPSVIAVLEKAEEGLLADFTVLELHACVLGCFGSPLFAEDPFVARGRWLAWTRGDSGLTPTPRRSAATAFPRTSAPCPRTGVRLDGDMSRAIEKLARIEEITGTLPGRNCGACGAPSCASLAEDIVLGRGGLAACPFLDGRQEP